jgi:predicted signal transduction protein with EAL and GGDEF domain
LSEPFELNGVSCNVGCSIGIAVYPEHGRDGEALLKYADIAMYDAKKDRNTFCFYDKKSQDLLT